MLAIAAELAEHDGLVVVVVVTPQSTAVRPGQYVEDRKLQGLTYLQHPPDGLSAQLNAKIRVHAVAINEGSHGRAAF